MSTKKKGAGFGLNRKVDPKKAEAFAAEVEQKGTGQASKRSKTQASERSDVQTSERPGIVERRGRMLADGSRRGARKLRRMTVYLPPELGTDLDVLCASTGQQKSDVIAEALRNWMSQGA